MTPRKRSPAKTTSDRARKPPLPRTTPIRSWSTLFDSNQATPPNGAPEKTPAGGGAGDAVQRGVELGYRVLDNYMRQGAAAAGAFAGPSRATPSSDDLPKMTARMLQYTSDFTSLWFDAMRVMGGQASQPVTDGDGRASPLESPVAPTRHVHWVVEVRSEQPAEIIIAFDEPLPTELIVEPLRSAAHRGKGGKTIADVSIRPPAEPGGPLRVRVHVSPKMPSNRYTGAVLDAATRQPKGRITVTLAK
jgi:hypothetical protein